MWKVEKYGEHNNKELLDILIQESKIYWQIG